jgi:hypothetical protein
MSNGDDRLVFLLAELHEAAAEAKEMQRTFREQRARWQRNRKDLVALVRPGGANSLDLVEPRRQPLLVRRWPGVYGKPS